MRKNTRISTVGKKGRVSFLMFPKNGQGYTADTWLSPKGAHRNTVSVGLKNTLTEFESYAPTGSDSKVKNIV